MERLLLIAVSRWHGGAKALEAFRAAKRVRREVPLASANTSLFSFARPELEKMPSKSRVAILGAGEMGALVAKSLENSDKGLCGLARTHGLGAAYSFLDEAGLTRETLEISKDRVRVDPALALRVFGGVCA